MRSMLTATLIIVATGVSVQAQMTAPAAAGAKPKQVATVPIRPALQSPADTANAMAQAERQAIQSDLAWVGEYNGAITGEVSERMVAAIKEFQKARGGKQTGVLNPQERAVLAETAKKRQDNVGWKIVTDPGTGARLGVPTKLVPQQSSRRQQRQMEFFHRDRPDSAFTAQGSQPHHGETRRARKERPLRAQGGIRRGQAGVLCAVGHAGTEKILRARPVQGR